MTLCKHCGSPIRLINNTFGPEWLHGGGPHGDQYPISTHDMFAAYRHCRTAVAEPAGDDQMARGRWCQARYPLSEPPLLCTREPDHPGTHAAAGYRWVDQ